MKSLRKNSLGVQMPDGVGNRDYTLSGLIKKLASWQNHEHKK